MAQASCRSRMAEASTMLRTMKRLMALSLGTCNVYVSGNSKTVSHCERRPLMKLGGLVCENPLSLGTCPQAKGHAGSWSAAACRIRKRSTGPANPATAGGSRGAVPLRQAVAPIA